MTALATVADLARRLGLEEDAITGVLLAQWEDHLQDASDAVIDAVGCQVEQTTSTITLTVGELRVTGSLRPRPFNPNRFLVHDTTGSQLVKLPAVPAVELVSVTDDYGDVEATLIDAHTMRVWATETTLTVTYVHGWDPIPNELKRWTCVLAASSLQAAKSGNLGMAGGLSSVKIDDGSISYAASDPGSAIEIPEAVRARLRATYGPSLLEVREL